MINKLKKLFTLSIIKYLLIAGIIVVIELAVFAFLNDVLGVSYLIATPASVLLSILLNWYGGRRFVFSESTHTKSKEFSLVFIASLAGMGLQVLVAAFVVEIVNLDPFIAKLIAVGVTFFYNFFIRRYYIYKS